MLSTTLTREIEAYAKRLERHPLLKLAQQGELGRTTVATYLVSILYLIRHTPTHLAFAQRRAEELRNCELARFFAHKGEEERGHDRWAESDLKRLQLRFEGLVLGEPCMATRDLVAYLERRISADPEEYLVYILFAEYFTVLLGEVWVSALETHCGIPAAALTVVSNHVDLDRAHVAEGVREIDDLLRSVRDESPFLSTLRSIMEHFERFCDDLHRRSSERPESRQSPAHAA